jgi:NADPH:quinone reductase-like Zn-dependent oxidoreductase
MKAAVRSKYGSGEVLSIQEIDKPTPKDNEVLIRVYAASVNRSIIMYSQAGHFSCGCSQGLFKPKLAVTGSDFAGQVEATGPAVNIF